jgi:hypothetical protein
MELWLVTGSDHYYPRPGVDDWKLLTLDEDKARKCFTKSTDESLALIRIETFEDETCVPNGAPEYTVVLERR